MPPGKKQKSAQSGSSIDEIVPLAVVFAARVPMVGARNVLNLFNNLIFAILALI